MLRRYLRDQNGAMFAEYALMVAIICGGLSCIAYFLGDSISDAMTHVGRLVAADWDEVTSDKLFR